MRTNRELVVTWGPNATPLSNYETTVPAGHPVTYHGIDPTGAVYFAEPRGLVVPGTIEAHDAEYYGIRIPADAIDDNGGDAQAVKL